MKFFLLLSLILINTIGAYSQEIVKKYVLSNFKAIDLVTDTSFNVIGRAIGDARIVMLDEQDHGDGSTFSVKCKLVRFLHEQMGFNVIAFESDFYSINQGWKNAAVKDSINLDTLIKQNIYPVWTKCKQCSDVFQYLKTSLYTSRKLELTAFDNQLTGVYGYYHFLNDLTTFLDSSGIPFVKTGLREQTLLSGIKSVIKNMQDFKTGISTQLDTLQYVEQELHKMYQQLSVRYTPDNFFMMLIQNFSSLCREKEFALKNDIYNSEDVRDKQMAENLLWLANKKYAREKIIVWAANSHIFKNETEVYKNRYSYPCSMGCNFTKAPGMLNQTYIIGFTGYEGVSERAISKQKIKTRKPEANSFEGWINSAGFKNGFIDFRLFLKENAEFTESFIMNSPKWAAQNLFWPKVYDGVYYIKETEPCKFDN